MRVIVLTSDKYLHSLKPFAALFNKYWSVEQAVLVAGFTPPDFDLPPNFTFHSIGAFKDYPVGKWSDAVLDLFSQIEDEAFVLMLEDYWLIRPVDRNAVRMLYDYARQFTNVLRIDLTADRLYRHGPRYPNDEPDYGYCGYLDLVYSEPTSQYHMSMMPGVWRRDSLIDVLKRGWSPWQVELDGTRKLMTDHTNLLVLGTRQAPVRITLGYRGGNPGQANLDGLRAEDIAAVMALLPPPPDNGETP